MLNTEATQYIKATMAAFGTGEAISMTQDTWAKLHEAMSVLIDQPKQMEQEPEWKQIAEDLRFHGLTLVKTATGYAVLKLGAVHAQATPPAQRKPLTDEEQLYEEDLWDERDE